MLALRIGKKLVLDTCVIINIMQNRAAADLIKCHIDAGNFRVYLNSISLEEASRKGYGRKEVISKVQEYLDTLVIVKEVTEDTHTKAQRLEDNCPLIHHGDSAITAFAVENSSTLITYDRDLLKGCETLGIPALSPNMIIGGHFA